MPRLMIECPDTHKLIYTGQNFNWETFESAKLGESSLPCAECGKVHRWTRMDAILDETGDSS
jgi:hypothetical protein